MIFYTKQHKYYCGIDLHTNKMYVCILDEAGEIMVHRNINTEREVFLKVIEPYREDIVICVECMFTWYWIADLCSEKNIPFVPGHALYMKAINGGKAKNDRIDSLKITWCNSPGVSNLDVPGIFEYCVMFFYVKIFI